MAADGGPAVQLPPAILQEGAPGLEDEPKEQPEEEGTEEEEDEDPAAYVPFISDAPSETEDSLDRGPLALFLGRRLHLIWRELNGAAPGAPPRGKAARATTESDTFIVHIDAPWGGGKTTFANFLSRVLDPRRETLTQRHFLKPSMAPGERSDEDLEAIALDAIFLSKSEAEEAPPPHLRPPGQRPWIVVWSNAWRDQYVVPPWWQLYLAISSQVGRAALEDATYAARDAWMDAQPLAWLRSLESLSRWLRITFAGLQYRLLNAKLMRHFGLTMIGWLVLVGGYITIQPQLAIEKLKVGDLKTSVDLVVLVLGLLGGGLATLGTLISQSVAPDIDFTDESKHIGVRDPIARFRRTFEKILLLGGRPVLLVVDDLDRCEPSRVVEVLRGFQTIVRSSRLFVLVLGDRKWIESAHSVWHKDLASGLSLSPETPLGARFVEKLFQLSFTLPAMKAEARDRYTLANLSRGDGRGRQSTAPTATPAAVAPAPTPPSDLLGQIQSVAGGKAAAPQKQRAIQSLIAGSGLEGESRDVAEQEGARQMAIALGADAGYQAQVRNILTGLANSLPNNPRQIKRIFNAFAVYETVGRLYFQYAADIEQAGEVQARRWRQLALWVTLSTDWPETWRRIARQPTLLEAAYGPTAKARKAAEAKLAANLSAADAADLARILLRLRNDGQLSGLLAGSRTPVASDDATALFASTALEPAAVYEFNRIMWEPDFPLSA
jgi:hypothetical protein